jgi:hypothetical protein
MEYPWEMYTLKELLQATSNFSESNKLGEGGFGTVYWDRTSKGVEVRAFLYDPSSCLVVYPPDVDVMRVSRSR